MTYLAKYKLVFLAFNIFILTYFSFIVSMRPFNTTDSFPNNLVALNWLINKRLDLTNLSDEIQERGIVNITVTNSEGTVYPKTPLILGILNIPGFAAFNKYFGISFLTDKQMVLTEYHQFIGKYLAAFYTSLSAVFLFLLIYNLFKNTTVSILTTLTYTFATSVFNTISQANWQHGISLLFITLLLLTAIKKPKKLFNYFFAGLLLSLLTVIRISNIFYLPLIVVSLFGSFFPRRFNGKQGKRLLIFILGFLTVYIPIYYLNSILKVPYGYESAIFLAFKTISPINFILAVFSIFFSFNVGLFVYSPVLLLALTSIRRLISKTKKSTAELFIGNSLPTLALFIIFLGIWPYWTGGTSLGARLLSETLPIWSLLIAYFLISYRKPIAKGIFVLMFFISIFINLLTTFMIDGWWFALYTKQTPESQLTDAWFHSPSLFEYLLKTRIFYYESFKKEGDVITDTFSMRRPTFESKSIVTLYEKKSIILDLTQVSRDGKK